MMANTNEAKIKLVQRDYCCILVVLTILPIYHLKRLTVMKKIMWEHMTIRIYWVSSNFLSSPLSFSKKSLKNPLFPQFFIPITLHRIRFEFVFSEGLSFYLLLLKRKIKANYVPRIPLSLYFTFCKIWYCYLLFLCLSLINKTNCMIANLWKWYRKIIQKGQFSEKYFWKSVVNF